MGLLRRLGSLPAGGRALLGGIAVLILAAGTLGFLAWRTGHEGQTERAVVPQVVALVADKGGPVANGDLVPSGTPLRLTFNTAMNPGTVVMTANGARVGLSWAHDGRSATLDTGAIRIGPVALAIGRGGRGAGGGPLAPWSLSFSSIFAARAHTVPLATPVLIQVPNDPAARDQSGLQSAAIVYEYLTEGGITRFTAIFVSAPDEIGPVRSGRLISFALTRRYRGLLMASGLSEGSAAVLQANPVPHVFDTGAGYFHRTADRWPPNNLYTSAGEVQRALASASLPPFSLPPPSVPIRSGPAAATVEVPEHSSTYSFDAATRTYTKQVDGRTLVDAATGAPLHIQLVVVMHTTATPTGYTEDVNGQPGLDFDMQSGGRADFWFDGIQASGRWSSPSATAPLQFELDSGAVVRPPALTWVDVVTG
jgi:hypothetical protein